MARACAECNATQGIVSTAPKTASRQPVMRREIVSDITFWFVAALGATMLVVLLGVVSGAIPVSSPATDDAPLSESAATPPVETLSASTAAPTKPATTPDRTVSARTTTQPASTPPPPRTDAVIVVTAARGESWFSARLGSEEGQVLDERVLAQGESVRLEGRRIWLSVGAAGNVDLTVNGKPRSISPGTVELVLTRPAPAAS